MEVRSTASARHVIAAMLALGGVLAGCNLVFGITEDGLRVADDAGIEAAPDVQQQERPPLEPCTRDVDCVPPNGCYTPHCDTVVGACTYALCEAKGKTCAMGTCNTDTFACSDPLPYTLRATSYDVPDVTSGCGADPTACVAAAFPFVFLGTRDNVVALRGDDLVGKAPVKVPIADLTVDPQQLVASGRRIWVLGSVQGEAPPYQLAIGSIDVPSDPTVKTLRAKTTLVSYPFPTAVAFPAPRGGLFLVHNDANQGFPTAILSGPPPDGAKLGLANAVDAGPFDAGFMPSMGTLTMFRVTAPAGSSVVASTGARLVIYRYPLLFNLLTGAGTSAAATQGDFALTPPVVAIGPLMAPAATFASGADGALIMAAPIQVVPMGDCNCYSNGRVQWVFPNAVATAPDVNQYVDVATWFNPTVAPFPCSQCPLDYVRSPVRTAWLDGKTALTATQSSGVVPATRGVTDIRVVGRDPINGYPKRKAQTRPAESPKGDFATDRIALTASNGIGYLVLSDGQGNDVSLSIIDPRCESP